jgi:pimeloyl-ACP methyl ester carboxylesterase
MKYLGKKPGGRLAAMAWALAAMATLATLPSVTLAQSANWAAERGTLPRGTTYEMRKPNAWNGVLIDDLDFAATPDAPRYLWLLNHGYAVSGTARRADRFTNYDPAHEVVDLINVMDLFEAKWGRPKRTIQLGQSGGGHIALAFAEMHPDRVDGVVSTCAHTPVWLMNSELDAWFVLQKLIAPNLQIVDLPADVSALTAAWRAALTAAQKTSIGRARIALATTIGQLPAWVSSTTPEPNPDDIVALQKSMYESLITTAAQPAGQSRFMFEHSANGQLSWNNGVDYAVAFKRGDPAYQRVTKRLYEAAGASLDADLEKVNEADRIEADPKAVKWWSYPGRTVLGEPKVPVLRIHTNGDAAVPVSLVAGYDSLVKTKGYQELYRRAFVNAPGHCNFNPAEVAAAVETMVQRLDTGEWPSTSPTALNKLGSVLNPTTLPRYYAYQQFKYNRTWTPSVLNYLGRHDESELSRAGSEDRALADETGENALQTQPENSLLRIPRQ